MSSESRTLEEYAVFSRWYGMMYPDGSYGTSDVDQIRQILDRCFALREAGKLSVLDCACGIGCPSIGLSKFGYRVVATDGSPAMLSESITNAGKKGADITFVPPTLWSELISRFEAETFDCVICTGNAIYHEPPVEDGILLSLRNMYGVLRSGGICIVDTKMYTPEKEELWFDRRCGQLKVRRGRTYGPYGTNRGILRVDTECSYDNDLRYDAAKRQTIRCLFTMMKGEDIVGQEILTMTGYSLPYQELEEWMIRTGFSKVEHEQSRRMTVVAYKL